jgi:hypothetical protein
LASSLAPAIIKRLKSRAEKVNVKIQNKAVIAANFPV